MGFVGAAHPVYHLLRHSTLDCALRKIFFLVVPIVFISGFCSLVYQTVWLREFRLVFGASTSATAAVVAIFMGELGLGSLIFGKLADRWRRPLAAYAIVEMVAALASALTPVLIDFLRGAYAASGGTFALGQGMGTIVRLAIAAIVLAIPTIMMGATLPILARLISCDSDARRGNLAFVYAANTLGAVSGVLLTTFVLLSDLGGRGSLYLAVALNLLISGVAFLFDRHWAQDWSSRSPLDAPESSSPNGVKRHRSTLWVVGAAFVVGFVFFLMELVWYRMLSPLLGGSTFTFGIILAVALLGIGLGSLAYKSALKGKAAPGLFGLLCSLEALFLAAPLVAGDDLAFLALQLRSLGAFGFWGQVVGWLVPTLLVVLAPAFIAGLQFPLLISLLGVGGRDVARDTGTAYAANTLGAIFGSLAGGFGLLPILGATGSWRTSVFVLAATGLGAAIPGWRKGPPALVRPAAVLAAVLAVAAAAFSEGPGAAWRHKPIGAVLQPLPASGDGVLTSFQRAAERAVFYECEGIESSIAMSDDEGVNFIVNGKVDGNSITDRATQIMIGMLGPLLHPEVTTSLVIGLGTGSSAGWAADLPGMQRVHVVELEPAILDVARECAAVNRNVLANPNVRILIGDAREHLIVSNDAYDVIVSEPSNPYRAGIANLYTREFYSAARKRLNPGGLFIQWLQVYGISTEGVISAISTLNSVFPEIEIWQGEPGDLLLVAGTTPINHDPAALSARMRDPLIAEALLKGWSAVTPEEVLAHRLAGPDFARAVAAENPTLVNTDDLPMLEFVFARQAAFAQTAQAFDGVWGEIVRRGAVPTYASGIDAARLEAARNINLPRTRRGDFLHIGSPSFCRAQATASSRAGSHARALELWSLADNPHPLKSEVPLIAYSHALVSGLVPDSFLSELAPVDRALIDGIAAATRKNDSDSLQAWEVAAAELHRNPFATNEVLAEMMSTLPGLFGRMDDDAKTRIIRTLSTPFAAKVNELLRQTTILACAATPGAEKFENVTRPALARLERGFPWDEQLMKLRLEAYGRLKDREGIRRAILDLHMFWQSDPGRWPRPLNAASAPGQPGG